MDGQANMRFVVASAFRNAAGQQINRWMDQVLNLRRELRQKYFCYLRAVAVEGDSTDATQAQLQALATKVSGLFELEIVTCNHGGPVYHSTESPQRMEALSKVGNAILGSIRENDDIVIYVESDLIWDGATISALIDHVVAGESDVVAPLVFAGNNFYDVYLYRKNGERFGPFPPYHSQLNALGLTDVDSAGSCLVMRAEVARKCRIRDGRALLGFCDDVRANGYSIKVDSTLSIRHPA